MNASSGMAWYWPEGSHNGPRPKAEGHYGCPKVLRLIGQYLGHTTTSND